MRSIRPDTSLGFAKKIFNASKYFTHCQSLYRDFSYLVELNNYTKNYWFSLMSFNEKNCQIYFPLLIPVVLFQLESRGGVHICPGPSIVILVFCSFSLLSKSYRFI